MKYLGIVVLFLTTTVFAETASPKWTAEDKETWKKAVKKVVTTPPCCGACSVLSMRDGRKAYSYVTGEEKSEEGAKIYRDHEKRLLEAFRFFEKQHKEEDKNEK